MPKHPKQSVRRQTYHHGDLHRTLVAAAERLLEEGGVGGVSLRAACKAAGVSHAAPYRHFRGKAQLMEAVARAGFDQLGELCREARLQHPHDPESQLRDAGLAYVRWATDNPERTHLMFGGMMKADDLDPELHAHAEAAYAEIYRIIDAGRDTGLFGGTDTDSLVLSAWSTVHGLTMLILGSGRIKPAGPEEIRALAGQVCETLLSGIRLRGGDADAAPT